MGEVVFALLLTAGAAAAPVAVARVALAIVAVPANARVINGRLVMAPPQRTRAVSEGQDDRATVKSVLCIR
jgi:hypothetical protein